ncbi:hypothetical protein DdX_00915 [Ditylenchus destructor]|uniref:Uncharacterized protein n=1 Tax=Ditylenchus destructor TaxID=166010 RepID=A0AAD4NHW5_9BILA|nr:hypothetical protein DdX_00915 [Ditylenchus destructor]
MPMYRMLRSRTIDNSNGGSDSPARARVAGAGARKSSAGTNQQNQKKMSVPGSPTKNRPGQSKKYSIGATMVTSPLVASSGPPIALPKAPPLGSVDNNSGTQTPASPAAASLKKQRWSFAFRKRWFSSSLVLLKYQWGPRGVTIEDRAKAAIRMTVKSTFGILNPNGRTLCDNDGINEEDEALQHKGGVQQPISLAVWQRYRRCPRWPLIPISHSLALRERTPVLDGKYLKKPIILVDYYLFFG